MKNMFFGVLERLWVCTVLLYQIIIAALFICWEAFTAFLRANGILLRFFVAAPLLSIWVFARSPRNTKKERWVAWRLARADRFGRKLNDQKMKRLEEFLQANIIREVKRPFLRDDMIIKWETVAFELVPRKDLEVRT